MIVLNQTERELAQILLDHILNNRGKLTYKEAAQKLSSRLGTTINPHFDLSTPLGHISTCCFELAIQSTYHDFYAHEMSKTWACTYPVIHLQEH